MMNYIDQFAHEKYQNCGLCPRNCGVNRNQGQKGFCGETNVLRIADIEAHFGEEPPISGIHGSGTIFITGCSLKCGPELFRDILIFFE